MLFVKQAHIVATPMSLISTTEILALSPKCHRKKFVRLSAKLVEIGEVACRQKDLVTSFLKRLRTNLTRRKIKEAKAICTNSSQTSLRWRGNVALKSS